MYHRMVTYKQAHTLPKLLEMISVVQDRTDWIAVKEKDKELKHELMKIIKYVLKLKFQDRPDYSKLRSVLLRCKKISLA